MKLYCRKCKYKFEKEKAPFRCPYCSAENSVAQVESAQEILDEAAQEFGTMERSARERQRF